MKRMYIADSLLQNADIDSCGEGWRPTAASHSKVTLQKNDGSTGSPHGRNKSRFVIQTSNQAVRRLTLRSLFEILSHTVTNHTSYTHINTFLKIEQQIPFSTIMGFLFLI